MSSDSDAVDTDFAWTSTSEDSFSEPDTIAKMIKNNRRDSEAEEDYVSKIKKKRKVKLSSVEEEVIKMEADSTAFAKKPKKKKLQKEHLENGVDHHTQDADNDSYLDVRVKQEEIKTSKRIKKYNTENDDCEKAFSDISIKFEHKPSKKKKSKLQTLEQENVDTKDDLYLNQRIKQEIGSARDSSLPARSRPGSAASSPSPQPSPRPASRSPTPRRSISPASPSSSPRRSHSPASRSSSPRRSHSPASRSSSARRSHSPASRSPSVRRSHSPASRSPSVRRSHSPASRSPSARRRRSLSADTIDSGSVSPRSTSLPRKDKHSSNKKASTSRSTNSTHRKYNIADKIIFENDDIEQTHDSSQMLDTKTMKSFLKQNPHMKVTNPKTEVAIQSRDEDVWLAQCPTEVSLADIKTIDLGSEKKLLKMKVQGNSFEGVVRQDVTSVPVLLSINENHVIYNVSLQGVLNFHKRVPKTDIVEEQIAATNNSFIPLPETKCRHPLFGPNYKSALKISKAIAARLQAVSNNKFECTHRKKKKKHKKLKAVQHEMEQDDDEHDAAPAPVPQPSPPPQPSPSRQRKRKREGRADDSDRSGVKHAKRRKHTETEPSWESEQGIEESLFNY